MVDGLPVKVPAPVLEGLERVRHFGAANFRDRRAVAVLARRYGYPDAAAWVEEHPHEFAAGVLGGFEPVPDPLHYCVVCAYPDGSERVVERGLSHEHADGIAAHLERLDDHPECTYRAEPEPIS